MKQNASELKKGIIIRVFQDNTSPSKIRIELGSDIGEQVNAPYRQETQYIVDSLNDFFNEAAQTTSQQPLHKNAERVYGNIQTALKKYNKTRRRKTRRL
jgi:phage-related minor tail protein